MSLPIALDYRTALLSGAGIGRATRELAHSLAMRDDVRVHLFAHSLARARIAVTMPPRARLHRLPIPGRSLPLLRRFGLGADLLAGGVRVFHWLDFVHPPLSRARAVLTVHDLAFVRNPDWHGPNAETLRSRTLAAIAAAEAIVVPSAATANDVRTFAPAARRVHVIPFGADHVVAARAGERAPDQRPYALCVGTIEPRKNHTSLLAAWRRLPAPRPLLVVLGNIGWQCDDIVAALREAERTGDVLWLQHCDDAQMWRWLQHARLLVYPSLWEGFGFPPLEAMQLGVPVVGNDIAALRELGDEAMQFADAKDPVALAAAIERVLRDTARHQELSRLGRGRAAAFRWRDCAAAHAKLYREVAS